MKEYYLQIVSLIERLHRLFLEVIKCELDALSVDDINNVQALILYNLGGDQISIGELITKGCYLGSNVSYNLKKMVQNGYIDQISSKHDKRSYLIRLSNKGMILCKKLDLSLDKHVKALADDNLANFGDIVDFLRCLEIFWGNTAIQRVRFNMIPRKNIDPSE